MGNLIRKSISVFMIVLMIIPCSWLVYAEDGTSENEESTSPQETSQEISSETSEQSTVTADTGSSDISEAAETQEPEAASVDVEETPVVEETADEESGEGSCAEEPDAADTDADMTETSTEETEEVYAEEETLAVYDSAAGSSKSKKNITVAGTKLDCSSSSSGSGWTYDKDSETILLRDFTSKADISSDGTGVTLVTSGLNRIGTLSCDGQIDVIGSGILLIDKIELAKGSKFNLLPVKEMYGENGGSAAVFLLQKNGTYKLINGSVTGVIDERITTPDDVTLVMPENTSLELKALIKRTTYDEDGKATVEVFSDVPEDGEIHDERTKFYGGALNVSAIRIAAGASIINECIGNLVESELTIRDSLKNDGTIKGGTVMVNGDYSGSGVVEDAWIIANKGQTLSISIKDTKLELYGGFTINTLKNKGKSDVYYGNDTTIKNIKMSAGDYLTIYNKYSLGKSTRLKLNGQINGGTVFIRSGIVELAKTLKSVNGGTFVYFNNELLNPISGATVFNYSGIDVLSNGITGPVFMGPDDILVPDRDSVPVVSFDLLVTECRGGFTKFEEDHTGNGYKRLEDFDTTNTLSDGIITFDDLTDKYVPNVDDLAAGKSGIAYEVITCEDGKLGMTVLSSENEYSVESANVVLIRLAYVMTETEPEAGSALTSTLADRTGAGTIGGNSNAIFTGTGITRDKPDPIDPDDPDPVRPATVAAAAGDTLALQINQYDLNEGTDQEEAPYYVLSAYLNGAVINELGRSVEVNMEYQLPEEFENKPLYVVFEEDDEDAEEILRAVRAEYDDETGMLSFDTELLGEFVIAALDFEGEEFSPEFYDELEKVKEVQPLLELLKEKNGNAPA